MAIGAITLLLTVMTWSIIRDKPEGDSSVRPEGLGAQTGKRTIVKNIRRVLGERYFWPLAI